MTSHFTRLDLTVHVTPRSEHMRHRLLVGLRPGECLLCCIQSANVRRSKGRSPYSPEWSGFMPSSCQHLPHKGESKIPVWDFLPTTCRQQDVTAENCHVEQVEKEFFFLSASMFDSWPYSYWPSCWPYRHDPSGNFNRLRLPALLRFCVHPENCLRWVNRECLSTCTSLLPLHTTAVKSPLVLTRISPHLSLSVLCFRSFGIPCLFCLTVPQQ